MDVKLVVLAESELEFDAAQQFSMRHNLPLLKIGDAPHSGDMVLHFSSAGIYLSCPGVKKRFDVSVDFASGKMAHRRRFGGGKGQLIAKAIGLRSFKKNISVLDCTAGQGGDAFVMASLGCQVHMLERNFLAHVLLENALLRARDYARENDEALLAVLNNISLELTDAGSYFKKQQSVTPDVVYLDPMFPERLRVYMTRFPKD